MGMLSFLYKLRSSTALATPPLPRPRPGPRLVWTAPSVLGEHALAPEPTPALAPAPFEVDGVQVVYCTTYAEAKAGIQEMVADADGKPVALDLETCPVQFERERLAALLEERKTVNAAAIAFRKAAKKAGAPRPEIDTCTEEADAQLKILDAKIDYAESAGLDPNRAEIRTLQVYGGKARAAIIDIAKTGAEALGLLQGVSAVIHGSTFDLAFLGHRGVNLRKIHDTQQAARLTIGASKCSLARAVKHYLKVDLDKDLQASDWATPSLTDDQLTYAARDVIWLWRLAQLLFTDLAPQASAYKIQIAAAPAIARMNAAGIAIDLDQHAEVLRALAEHEAVASAAYQDACRAMGRPELAEKVPRSPSEIAGFLKAILTETELARWKRGKTTWELSTARPELRRAVHYPPIVPLIELSELGGLKLSFGEPLRFLVSPVTGRVHPRYQICGAPTGRSSTSKPNIQRAPRDPRIRGVFKAADGYVLVAADYNCMELRGAAYFFDDPQLAAVFERGDDLHKLTASHVAGHPIDTITDDERAKAKNVNFGTIYGICPSSLVEQIWKNYRLVISLADAEDLLEGFTALYPVMIAHRREYASACQAHGRIIIGPEWREGKGRIVPLDRLPKDQSTMTCAYSYPIQGVCSDICMKALAEVDRRLLADKVDGRLVGSIHDELIVESREADVERVKAILQSEMERAFIDTFPAATLRDLIEVKVAANWAKIKEKATAPAVSPILKTGSLRALDMFCGAGGASRGLQLAGFHVTGVDLEAQPHYIGDAFIQGDALKLDPQFLASFDLIWASPPCQAHTALKVLHNAHKHLDLVAATRAILIASGRPYVIENVPGAPLVNPVTLCATSFNLQAPNGAQLRRHRLFEASFPIVAPLCAHDETRPTIGIYGGHFRDRRRPTGANHQSGSNFSVDDGRAAMQTPWMTVGEISQAIPPAFSEYIARQFLRAPGQKGALTR